MNSHDRPIAILIVSGGPRAEQWLSLCLKRVHRHTILDGVVPYVWNNPPVNADLDPIFKQYPRVRRVDAPSGWTAGHPHAVPLQRLYETARSEGAELFITLDNDAFPIRDGWVDILAGQISEYTVLSGVWRDELNPHIAPYVHPSCLCVGTDFIDRYGLRFDEVNIKDGNRLDTLRSFTLKAEEHKLGMYKLTRSNHHQLHYIMGGLYGDLIYHHGAGSRPDTRFWGEPRDPVMTELNNRLNEGMQTLLFNHEEEYIEWLSQGLDVNNPRYRLFFNDLSTLSHINPQS